MHCTVYIYKTLPGEVETATWTDQDELTCTEMKLDRARMTKLTHDWIITVSKTCSFKETASRDGYFFEGLNILTSTFFVCADGFQAFQ